MHISTVLLPIYDVHRPLHSFPTRRSSDLDLVRFKHLIKNFLEKTVYDSYELRSSFSFHPHGNSKQLKTVQEIDEKLVELTEMIMQQEEKSVNLLDVIGEIKGLLVNLYT